MDGAEQPVLRKHDSQRTRANILAAATSLFAEKGYSAANMNEIVERAQITNPMVYYHFGNKEALFAAVLEEVYAGMRAIELSVQTNNVSVTDAMRHLVEATFDYHAAHPEWIRLIAVANIHDAQHIAQSATIASKNSAVLGLVEQLLDRGVAEGIFRPGLDPLHVHLLIASFCFYRISNRHTWKAIFGRDLLSDTETAQQREVAVQSVLRFLAV